MGIGFQSTEDFYQFSQHNRGERNPYKEAKLGVIQEGAWAELRVVDGDPTKDINVLKDPQRNLVVIIKDGAIYKNMLAERHGPEPRNTPRA